MAKSKNLGADADVDAESGDAVPVSESSEKRISLNAFSEGHAKLTSYVVLRTFSFWVESSQKLGPHDWKTVPQWEQLLGKFLNEKI